MEYYDVFISYPHHDQATVRPLVAALRTEGLEVWYDEHNIEDFASITAAINTGLAHAKALLVYYSPQYATKRACQWELTAAFLAAQRVGEVSQRLLVINPAPTTTHLHPVQLRDALFRSAPNPTDTQ